MAIEDCTICTMNRKCTDMRILWTNLQEPFVIIGFFVVSGFCVGFCKIIEYFVECWICFVK